MNHFLSDALCPACHALHQVCLDCQKIEGIYESKEDPW